MRRFVPPVPRRASCVRILSAVVVAIGLAVTTISAQIPGRNVNMVAGTSWPDGDPYLQRQNEPSLAASTRNPLHLFAGANDYRTVDLPGLAEDETGDAWLGVFKSYDGGQRWTSTLLPGYPQDHSALGTTSPIHGYGASADPVVRAGTNGLIYYAGLVFDRSNPATPTVPGKSAVFVARYIDNNNKEAGDTFEYLGTRALKTDPGGSTGNFLDKPWLAVDIPRDNTRCTIVTAGEKGPITQSVPAGPVYVAYTQRSTDNKGARYDVFFTRSADCGASWTTPVQLNSNSERANQGASIAIDPRNGNVYIAWRQFDVSTNSTGTDALMTVKYTLASKKIDPPGFARKFAKPKKGKGKGLDLAHFYTKGGVNKALEAAELAPLDQSTSALQIRFRTNAYPTMTIDENGRVYMVWAERGYDPLSPDTTLGSARVLMATSLDGQNWTAARPVSSENQKGHQLMPAITYAGGKLMVVYYDIRETRSQSFTQYIEDRTAFNDPQATGLRNTIDLRVSMASPGATPVFAPSVKVSEYIEGPRVPHGPVVPWQVNPPNLPMFQKGTAPFIGDYVDITAAPNFVIDAAGKWLYNSVAGSTPPIFHAAWTDNRDVRVPLEDANGDGNPWNDYAPPGTLGGTTSLFDPTQTVPQCIPGNAGSRNQNIYTARITGGLLAGSPGNTKRLGQRLDSTGAPLNELIERSFVVFAQNSTDTLKRFRFTITNQPVGGRASFDQFSSAPLTVIDADIPYRSTASRTVYATSTDPHASINVAIQELTLVGNQYQVKSGGLSTNVILNPDIDNPDIDNPDIDNPDIDNPDIDNAEVMNPDIDNPDIDNPDIDNPDIDNPDIDNPDIDNVEVMNPDIDNPDIDNPDIDNPDIDNPDIDNPDIDNPDIDNASLMTDVTWTMTNTGNTTASYNVNLFFAQQTFDPSIKTQLILYRTYKTPVVKSCELKTETRNVLVANIPNPQLVTSNTGGLTSPNDPSATNATIYLAPGESARITLRVFDPHPDPAKIVTVTNADGSTAKIVNAFVPNEDVTPVIQQQGVNTEDKEQGVTVPSPVVQFPPPQTVTDSASTSENTPVNFNVLANDSTAFGSTKILSFHPAGMAAHSGATAGDIAYQPSTGFLYTMRGAVDPATNTLVGRFAPSPEGSNIVSQVADPVHGVNYGRTGSTNATLTALDTRPGSPQFHRYLSMPVFTNAVLALGLDPGRNRLYAATGVQTATSVSPAALQVIDIGMDDNELTHEVSLTVPLPNGVRPQQIAVNKRTNKVYVSATGTPGSPGVPGGVWVIDMSSPTPAAVKINNVNGALGVVVNEASNMVFASASLTSATVFAIDGATNASVSIPISAPMRTSVNDERLAVHEASGKVYLRLESAVIVIDGQRGSPTRNTVVATIPVGRENGGTDIAIDQDLGLVVTVGSFDFRADIISVAGNNVVASIPLSTFAQDVAIDPVHHRAFLSVFTYVQEVNLNPISVGAAVPVFIESGGILLNPVKNKGYAGLFTTSSNIEVMAGSGFLGALPGALTKGRYLYGDWHNNTNRGYIINQADESGTTSEPGSVMVIDGATEAVLGTIDVPSGPFGIGIDQANDKAYVATLSAPTQNGTVAVIDANNPSTSPSLATFATSATATYPQFPLTFAGGLIGFGRQVVPNPANHKVYVMQLSGASPTSAAVLDPVTLVMKPLDGIAGSPLFDAANPSPCGGPSQPVCASWGRVNVIRAWPSLNRIYLGLIDNSNNGRIVAIDSSDDHVVATWVGGSHSNRHTASFIALNEAQHVLYVTDYTNNKVTMLDAATLTPIGAPTSLPGGPSATAFNKTANRLYVSAIDGKTIYAIDGTTLQVMSSVKMPLTAYFIYVDEVESRLYTSGGDSMDESGAMIITDVLGQLGTNVTVTSAGSAMHGTTVLNSDGSITYTPTPGYSGADSFNYNIAAPTGTAIGTVNVTVVPSVTSVIAFSDAYNVTANQTLIVPAPGPLGNDATGSSSTTMVVDQNPAHGTLTPQPDGSFTYQPAPGFTGGDSFIYHASTDANGTTNPAIVTITVTSAASLVVTNTADTGAGSLRQAMTTASIEPGSTITFNIAGSGVQVITPQSALPTLTSPTVIDGYTQPGAVANSAAAGSNAVIKIQVRGTSAGGSNSGFVVAGGNSTIRGLSITNFGQNGIVLDTLGGNVVEGNFIGLTPAGGVAGNSNNGVVSQSVNNIIGGSSLASRNVISGNTQSGIRVQPKTSGNTVINDGTGTIITNNLVGTDLSGIAAAGNLNSGIVVVVPNVTIGGTTAALRNVISGNTNSGINSFAQTNGSPQVVLTVPSNMVVQGNYIGVGADGSTRVANTSSGVFVAGAGSLIGGATGTTPGGACTGACNVISGNNSNGINVSFSQDSANHVVTTAATGSTIQGNYIGVAANGTTRVQNNNTGVSVVVDGVTVGGTSPNERNVISGNNSNGVSFGAQTWASQTVMASSAANGVITGNYIGVATDGQTAVANTTGGISANAPGIRIGGTTAGERNVIAGNGNSGLFVGASTTGTAPSAVVLTTGSGVIVEGNYIGVAADGATARPNASGGVFINATGATIGGNTAGARNVISGNGGTGLSIGSHFDSASGQVFAIGSGATITGNYIGVNAAGTGALANNGVGLSVTAQDATIGGPTAADRNVIAGNVNAGISIGVNSTASNTVVSTGANTKVQGNYVGLNASGTGVGNGGGGINVSAPDVTIGGSNAGEGNVVSGNSGTGISSFANRNGSTVLRQPTNLTVQGNYVGTSVAGTAAIPNTGGGIRVAGTGSHIGGTIGTSPSTQCVGACNLVSGNGGQGISLGSDFDNSSSSTGTVYSTATSSFVEGNFVGVTLDGQNALPNSSGGISTAAPLAMIGGASNARNVVSGNNNPGISVTTEWFSSPTAPAFNTRVADGANSTIRGNIVGLTADGNAVLSNGGSGITSIAPNTIIDANVIGQAYPANGINLGRFLNGAVLIDAADGTTIQNNSVGLTADGSTRTNSGQGINVSTANNQILNNTVAGAGVPGNGSQSASGISLFNTFATGNIVRGNIVGTNSSGAAGLGNTARGISIGDASGNTIGGPNPADANVVVGNGNAGISIDGTSGSSSGNVIQGNFVGVRANGNVLANSGPGISLFANNASTISGNTISNNVIGGNSGDGITLGGAVAGNVNTNTFAANFIGVLGDGTTARGNTGQGVFINNASDNTFGGAAGTGLGNYIANNNSGITMQSSALRNKVLSNVIHDNTNLGIDLGSNGVSNNDPGDGDNGANNQQNFPPLSNANNFNPAQTEVDVDLSSFIPGTYTIQVFSNTTCDASGFGEGAHLVGNYVRSTSGTVGLFEVVPNGQFLTATATDSNGNTSEFSACTPVSNTLSTAVTNSSDSGPGSLRQAMLNANATAGTQTITFNIPGANGATPAVITLASPLPVITEAVNINGTSQSGYDGKPVIEVNGQNAVSDGFQTATDVYGITIQGLAVTGFTHAGVFLLQTDSAPGGGSNVSNNYLGTDRFGNAGKGNAAGIVVRSDSSMVSNNVISGNTVGVRLENDADSVVISTNKIGVMADGVTPRPNSDAGIRMYDSLDNNIITNNLIARNGGWGIDVQDSAAGDVRGTMIDGNTIGLDANGNIAGNLGGGVRLANAPATDLGMPGGARNVISGNGGPNPMDIGVGVQVIGPGAVNIRNNYIGLDPTGVFARSNNNKGIVLDGVAQVGGPNANDRNYISGNGDISGGAGIIINPMVPNGTIIQNNVIGLNVNNDPLGNGYAGITVRSISNVTIGGTGAGVGNVISSNGGYGIALQKVLATDPVPMNTTIEGNIIGADPSGNIARGNASGGILAEGNNLQIGAFNGGNQIVNNGGAGVTVAAGMTGVRIETNRIDLNSALGVDRGQNGVTANDPGDTDGVQNFLTISSASNNGSQNTFATVDTNEITAGHYLVEFFKSPTCDPSGYGEGATSLIRFGVNAQTGVIQLDLNQQVPQGWFVTNLVTSDATASTSEFSNCRQVTAAPSITGVDPAAFASGQMIEINGSNFSPQGTSDILFLQGSNGYPAQSIFTNLSGKLVVRTPAGMANGPATVMVSHNGTSSSTPFNVTIQTREGTPDFITMRNGTCGGYGGPGDTSQSWADGDLLIVAAGIDTSGAKVLFTPQGGGPSVLGTEITACGFAESGSVALHVQVPALAPGNYNVTVRSNSLGQESLDSNARPLTIIEQYINAQSGGGGFFQVSGTLLANQSYTVSANGVADTGGGVSIGPNGNGSPCGIGCTMPTAARGALIGRINGGGWFVIGASFSGTNVSGQGWLELAVNDDNYLDNFGGFNVTVNPQ